MRFHLHRLLSFTLIFSLAVFLAGCDQGVIPTETDAGTDSRRAVKAPAQLTLADLSDEIITIDDKLAAVAKDVPGFGGFFYNDAGELTLYLKDPGRHAEALSALRSTLGGARMAQAAVQKVLPAQYDYAQLQRWRLLARKYIFDLDAVIRLGIDESQNRLNIGLLYLTSKRKIILELDRIGIPREAVVFEEVEPFKIMVARSGAGRFPTHLDDEVRPLRGGLMIDWTQGLCTLGFTAQLSWTGQTQTGFITNSHCTPERGTVDGTEYFQNDADDSGEYIGYEMYDPAYCCNSGSQVTSAQLLGPPQPPTGDLYRYSDAAFIKYAGIYGSDVWFGRIARTEWRGQNSSGSVTLDGGFEIIAEDPYPYRQVGDEVNKVGFASGWTYGNIDEVCVDIRAYDHQGNPTGFTYYCQTVAQAYSASGDSGSPVFGWDGNGNEINLVGLLHSGKNSFGTHYFAYSPLNLIEQEIGQMEVIF